jgi:hypothetical protein
MASSKRLRFKTATPGGRGKEPSYRQATQRRGKKMALYKVHAYAKRTRKLTETEPTRNSNVASGQATQLLKTNKFKVIVIVRDDEGESHPDNAGKFFLDRIIK